MKRNLAILGSTGSIGTQALEVVSEHPDLFEVYALTANNQVDLLINQARKYMPEVVVIANEQKYPELKWLHHIPNGGSRNRAEAVKLKQMGVKSGVSDLCLPYPKGIYCGLYIEMKYDKGRHQPSQKEFLTDMAAAGHYVATCYTAEEAIKVIEEYINLIDGNGIKAMFIEGENKAMMSVQNNSVWKDGEVKPLKV